MKRIIKLIKWLIKLLRKAIKIVVARLKRSGKAAVRKAVIAYVAALLPLNVASALAFTPASSVGDIVNVVKAGGVVNAMAGGIVKPLESLTKSFMSDVASSISDITGSQTLADTANDWRSQAQSWRDGSLSGLKPAPVARKSEPGNAGAAGYQPSQLDVDPLERTNDYYELLGPAQIDGACPQSGVNYTGRINGGARVGPVCAVVTDELVDSSKGGRRPFEDGSTPAGWGMNEKVTITQTNGRVYRGWMYNRSHLLADSLGGAGTYENLVTGTRTQNVGAGSGGMAYIESKVRSFMNSHDGCSVTYRVEPVYVNDGDVIPRWVRVDAKSCDGTIDESVAVFNDVAGYKIDYVTGSFAPQ